MFFDQIGQKLLSMMGHSGMIPGALMVEELPLALATLKKALADVPDMAIQSKNDDDDSPAISLAHRAVPLMALLEAAWVKKSDVMWVKL